MRRVLIIVLLSCLPAACQIMQVTGGQSNLMGIGAGITTYLPNGNVYVGAGCTSRCAFGITDRFKWNGWETAIGDSSFGYSLDGGGFGTLVRGFNLQRQTQQQTVAFFAGSSALGISAPYFIAAEAQHVGAGLFFKRKVRRFEFGTLEAFAGGQRTAIEGGSYSSEKLKASATGGILNNQRILNANLDFHPVSNLHYGAGQFNTFYPLRITGDSVNIAATWRVVTANANANRAVFDGRTIEGESAGIGLHIGPASLQSNWFQSAGTRMFSEVATEQVSLRLSLQQIATEANGRASFGAGGAYHDNHITVSISQSVQFVPLRGWQQVASVQISLHIPHSDAALNLQSNTLPTGQVKYAASISAWVRGPLNLQSPGSHQMRTRAGRYVVSGTALDTKGKPVEGAAVKLGSDIAFSDSAGMFYVRLRKNRTVAVQVSPDDFVAPGTWVVVSAPDSAKPGEPITVVVNAN